MPGSGSSLEKPGESTGQSSIIILKSIETKLEFYNSEFINKIIILLNIYIIFIHEN